MKKLTTIYNNNVLDNNETQYLHFKVGNSKYGVNITNVVEIMKLPLLEYPQKLPNNIIGILKYNNFIINVLDLRFYLNIKIEPYSTSNQLLIVKTDESIFGLIIDKVENITPINQSKTEYLESVNEEKIIDFMYQINNDAISAIDLCSLENIFKQGNLSSDIDIPSLFPRDDDSQYEFKQRSLMLKEKSSKSLISNDFSQDNFISFSIGESIYCINLEFVKEFLKSQSVTPIPGNFDYIEGVIVLRGDFITVINTKTFLGLNDSFDAEEHYSKTSQTKNNIIIVEISDYKVGFLVDEIFKIMNIPEDLIKTKNTMQDKYVQSEVVINDKLYSILNIKNILSDEKFYIED